MIKTTKGKSGTVTMNIDGTVIPLKISSTSINVNGNRLMVEARYLVQKALKDCGIIPLEVENMSQEDKEECGKAIKLLVAYATRG